ncbi:MAG TPA: A24 family peptidase [Dehalococcoidia bacterium]|nr:A24 family peptidase [Dehalococcoidia bacterium]
MEHGRWILALTFVALAGWIDWRSRRIPNWLTVPALFIGLGFNTAVGGWVGAKSGLLGALLMLALLLPLVLLRALGAGDWKLMGALGSFLGPALIFLVFVGTIFVTGMMALIQVIRLRRVRTTLVNMGELVRGFFVYGLAPHPVIRLDNPQQLSLPYGVAVAAATALCYGAGLALTGF